MSVISVEIRSPRRDAMSAAGFRCAFWSGQRRSGWSGSRATVRRARLDLMVVGALATLAVLLGVTLTDTSAAATSTPLLAGVMNAFVPTPHAVVPDEEADPLASTGGRDDAPRSEIMAAALGSTDVTPPLRFGDRSGPGTPPASVARVTAEAFAAGAGSAGSGVHSDPVSSGGSGGLAILLALGMLPDRRLPRQVFSDYHGHVRRASSRPLIRPG
ncbi:MAG TPA: hypothetical protein VK784_06795 [Pseudonocardiaceae bacterium]|jgi:hypothetical protein|nr:hypothetical protein [Pseudonocardiaceae bacterium]